MMTMLLFRKVIKKITILNRSRKVLIFFAVIITLGFYYVLQNSPTNFERTNRSFKKINFQAILKDCNEVPPLSPFPNDYGQEHWKRDEILCQGEDWVRCYASQCKLSEANEIQGKYTNITCGFKDVLYHSDESKSTVDPTSYIKDNETYELVASDHVKVSCSATAKIDGEPWKWSGNVVGLRTMTSPSSPPPGQDSFNVMILGFDTVSRTEFWKQMPESWHELVYKLRATVMEGYSVIGDSTASAILPILTGMTDSEWADFNTGNHNASDSTPLIFHKLKKYGYRTAYFENIPSGDNIFPKHLKDSRNHPADHYFRPVLLEEATNPQHDDYCVGDTPEFKLMLNVTEQFMDLSGRRFAFTFFAGIAYCDSNMIQSVRFPDEKMAALLRDYNKHREDTLLVVMSDHGPRNGRVRDTLRGKLEERLPLMALVLPYKMLRTRPCVGAVLNMNARTITTPYDLHATLLDVLGMKRHAIMRKEPGSRLYRGLTMLKPIPRNRRCSDAGVAAHWCNCLCWQDIPRSDPFFNRTADALLKFINTLLKEAGPKCIPRTLVSISWVMVQAPSSELSASNISQNIRGYNDNLPTNTPVHNLHYQIKVVLKPGRAKYEATMLYDVKEDRFVIKASHISRTNPYKYEPHCITETHPHLEPFCYCRQLKAL